MHKKLNSRITGPTDLPPIVRDAVNQQMISHRSQEFKTVFARACKGMQKILNTSNSPMFFTCSGTGGLEAAIVNTLGKGEKVLALNTGYYGDIFAAIAQKHVGNNVFIKKCTPGDSIDQEMLKAILQNQSFDAILLTHHESSMGVLNPLADLIATIREYSDALILVDAISSIGITEFHMDRWGVDVVITVPQKGLMAPPGLAILCASACALKKSQTNKVIGSFYFDFSRTLNAHLKNQTPFTPGIISIWGIDAALTLIEKEGFQNVFDRHAHLAKQCRAGAVDAGFKLFAKEGVRSPGITSILLPEYLSSSHVQEKLIQEYGIVVAIGLGEWEKRIVRIGHMGWVFDRDIQETIDALSEIHYQLSSGGTH